MIQSLIHTTDNSNSYIYDDQYRLSILIHPALKEVHEKSIDLDPYYVKKYNYLKEHGFFTEPKLPKYGTVTETMITDGISQISQIVFEVTDSCNLNCTYCGYGGMYEVFDKRTHHNINVDSAKKFLKYIYDLKSKSNKSKLMIGFYGGEPLLNMTFIKQIIEFANLLNIQQKVDIEYSTTTNATLIHKYIDFLVENNFKILISLDGDEKNHSYRVFVKDNKNSFHKVIDNIDMIQKDYPEYFANCINFNAVLHDRNSVKDIYQFIYNRYQKIPTISELLSNNIKPEKKEIFDKMYHSPRESEAEYDENKFEIIPQTHYESIRYSELRDFLKQISINNYMSNIISLFDTEQKYFPTDTCLPFSLKIFLTSHNRLLPCERINHKFYLGEVNEEVRINVREIANKYNSYYEHLRKTCQHCYAYRFCGLCLYRIKNLDKLDTEEFVCDRFYDQKRYASRLHSIFSFLEKYPEDLFHILKNE